MRAAQLDINQNEYLEHLVEEDVRRVRNDPDKGWLLPDWPE